MVHQNFCSVCTDHQVCVATMPQARKALEHIRADSDQLEKRLTHIKEYQERVLENLKKITTAAHDDESDKDIDELQKTAKVATIAIYQTLSEVVAAEIIAKKRKKSHEGTRDHDSES